jgi:sulfatase maturation enzyme AslB (radical SAM superfamily)
MAGPVHVVFTGGEALLKSYTIDLVSYASGIGLFTELLTHGYWEDQGKIERVALAQPARVTISFDGIGATHSFIRGRDNFFEKTEKTIRTLKRVRAERRLKMAIRLKTVIMQQNLEETCAIAEFAEREGLEVFYQPIEQNYNTPDDPHWFEQSPNWPRNVEKVVATVNTLQQLKDKGFPITNSSKQLAAMIPYFRNPGALRVATQSHAAQKKS